MKKRKRCVLLCTCMILIASAYLCVTGYKNWVKENEIVPYHSGNVKIATPIRYDMDDIGDKQTVFACRFINSAWGEQDELWVIGKDGMCRKKDLVAEAEKLGKINQVRYMPEEWSQETLLARMDEYMRDETLPVMDEKLRLDKETICQCINITDVNLGREDGSAADAGDVTVYVVTGAGANRSLKELYRGGVGTYTCGDEEIERVCKQITSLCKI